MNITEYQDIIHKTAVYPKYLGPAYTTLGLIGELGELATAVAKEDRENVKKEIGDSWWYIAATCNEFGISVLEVFNTHYVTEVLLFFEPYNSVEEAIMISTDVAEMVKKFCRDKTINLPLLRVKLNHIFIQINNAASHYGLSLEEILEANYTKLIKRLETNTLHGSGDNREEVFNVDYAFHNDIDKKL